MSFIGCFARVLAVSGLAASLVFGQASAGTTKYQGKAPQTQAKTKTAAKAATKTSTKTAHGKKRIVKPQKKQAVASSMNADWPKTFDLIRNHADPIGSKLIKWIYTTETSLPVETHSLLAFVRENPDWPRLHIYKRKIEDGISAELQPQEIVDWFAQNPPVSYKGEKAYIDALLKTGKEAEARAELANFWRGAELDKNQAASLYSIYKSGFGPGVHEARLDNLIWENRYTEAEYMLAFVGPDVRAAAQARIALGKMAKNAEALVAAVPASYQNSEGLLFERLRWRRRKDMDSGAMDILKAMPAKTTRPDLWWAEMNILARRRLELRDYAGAYAIASKHQLEKGFEYSQAEWLLGWLKLRYLKDAVEAYKHFDAMYAKVGTAISLSRAAYWAARAAEKSVPDKAVANQWDRIAAQYPSTFYGQLSYEIVYGRPKPETFKETPPPPETVAAFDKLELVHAIRVLHGLKLDKITDYFFARLIADAKTKDQYALIAKLALETGRYYYTVQANKDCQQTIGQFLFVEGYPTLPPLPLQTPEKALVHAIIHRESMFNPEAVSPVGARGLMQLMPGTAKVVAKKAGERYNVDRLILDPRYNALLGSTYLHGLVNDYGGFYPMAIGAYNAGPGNVKEWIQDYGDPRVKGGMNLVDWLEHIPIYETRNYIQRVMEAYYIYRLRFGLEPKTIYDFLPPK